MSLPHTGKVIARTGPVNLTFDGDAWTGDDAFLVRCLNTMTPQRTGTHITVEEAARDILNDLFDDDFEILYAKSDTWDEDLPPDSED